MNQQACANTDKEIWREQSDERDYYAPSMHVTIDGKIGINVGGHVIVKDAREWHKLANITFGIKQNE